MTQQHKSSIAPAHQPSSVEWCRAALLTATPDKGFFSEKADVVQRLRGSFDDGVKIVKKAEPSEL